MRHRRARSPARHGAPAPEERSLTEPRFIGAFPRADVPLDPPLPEIAFIGRSNVGKSSLLNTLVGRRIAKTSGTPGKTRLMNVFLIPGESREHGAVRSASELLSAPCYLLDLPGYGYARAGKADRAGFRRLLAHALERERLAGVVWLLDLRHEPSPDDRAMQDVLAAEGAGVLAALTKSDKLPRGPAAQRALALRETLRLDEDQTIVTSARTGAGIPELREAVAAFVKASA